MVWFRDRAHREERARAKAQERARKARDPNPTDRGWLGRGGGYSGLVQMPNEFRGSTFQVCGFWPFSAGTGTPIIGVPLGRSLLDGAATLCCDPISWFQRAKLISNPSAFVLGQPGYGKSTVLRRMMLGLAGFGVLPLVLGDLKGEHVDLVQALGGQVIRLGPGRGYVNVLDMSVALEAARRLDRAGFEDQAREIRADAIARRLTLVEGLVTLARRGPLRDRESNVLAAALDHLDATFDGIPVLSDLLAVIEARPESVAMVAVDRGDVDRYRDIVEDLVASLRGMMAPGRLGEMFSRQSTVVMRRDRPVVFDVSALEDADLSYQGAVLSACWGIGFGMVMISQVMAEVGLEPQRHYIVLMDELHRALRAGEGMAGRVDATTRLNRAGGYGVLMCTHTMSDLLGLRDSADAYMARGFVERAGMVITAALPRREFDEHLRHVVSFSEAEIREVSSWSQPAGWTERGEDAPPPGRGNFLVKIGGRPGIPFHVDLTAGELSVNDTNRRWHERSRLDEVMEDDDEPEARSSDRADREQPTAGAAAAAPRSWA